MCVYVYLYMNMHIHIYIYMLACGMYLLGLLSGLEAILGGFYRDCQAGVGAG